MNIRRKIKRQDYERWPPTAWNAYVHLLAFEKLEDLTALQADAALMFWYDSEVQNGGHFQYFVNKGLAIATEAVDALGRQGAIDQQRILADAIEAWNSRSRQPIETVEEFCDEALNAEFKSFDRAYYACKPTMEMLLKEVLKNNFAEFIEIE
jgi:hypothetical protein